VPGSALRLYHVSDQPGIEGFDPRPSPRPQASVPEVWAESSVAPPNEITVRAVRERPG
jgi:hypothetical protein